MSEEKIEEMWAKAKKFMEEGTYEQHLPEQMDIFSREILAPLAVRAFSKAWVSSMKRQRILF